MDQGRLKEHRRNDFFEELRSLRNSDYWPYLSQQNREDILSLLGEHRDKGVKWKKH